jgi:hypothetical protein
MIEVLRLARLVGTPAEAFPRRDWTTPGRNEADVEGSEVACNRHDALSSSSTREFLARGYLPLEPELEPRVDLDLFHPNFAPIFFHPLPSPRGFGLVLGDVPPKPVSDVGGVVGGVIGSRPEFDGELALSSVSPASCASGDEADDCDRYAERRLPDRLRAAERCE